MAGIATSNPPRPDNAKSPDRLVGARGWLLCLCVLLVIVRPLHVVVGDILAWPSIAALAESFPGIRVAFIVAILVDAGVTGFGCYAGWRLWSVAPGAVRTAKIFLVVQPCVALITPFVVVFIADAPQQFSQEVLAQGMRDFVLAVISCGLWFIYLSVSRRVRATYG